MASREAGRGQRGSRPTCRSVAELIVAGLPGAFAGFDAPNGVELVLDADPEIHGRDALKGYVKAADIAHVLFIRDAFQAVVTRTIRLGAAVSADSEPILIAQSFWLDGGKGTSLPLGGTIQAPDGRPLEIFRRDISPTVTEVLRVKLHNWLTVLLDGEFVQLASQMR